MARQISNIDPFVQLSGALAEITSAPRADLLWYRVKKFAGEFGYSYLTAIDASKMAGGMRDATLHSDLSPDTLSTIDRENLLGNHPILQRSIAAPEPFLISEVRNHVNHSGKRWTQLLADVVSKGDALIIPVYDESGLKGILSFGGAKPDLSPKVRAIIQVIAYAAFARARSLSQSKDDKQQTRISVRETQCLRLLAMGKTDSQIAHILDISARTVRFHVDNARRKLAVATRIQAIAKAVNDDLIVI